MKTEREPEFFEDDELSLAPIDAEEREVEEVEESEEITDNPPTPEEEEEETIDTTVRADEDEDNIYKVNFELLKESGALVLPEDFEFEATEEGFTKALEASKDHIRTQVLDELTSQLPKSGVELLNYMLQTGTDDISAFLEAQKEPDFETLEFAEEDETIQEDVIRVYLSNTTKYSPERIEKEISRYKLDGELYTQASEAKTELAAMQKEYKEQMVEMEKERAKKEKEQYDAAVASFSKTIESTSEFNGIPFTKEDAKRLTESVFKPVKTKEGRVTTKFNMKLEEALMDPKKTAVLAKLLEADLNLESFKKPMQTKVVKDVKTKLDKAVNSYMKGKTPQTKGGFDWESASLVKNRN